MKIIAFISAIALTVSTLIFLPEISDSKAANSFIITASAASYSTGEYIVNASDGVNIRTGPSTGYRKKGAASKGTRFTVTAVSSEWGYTDSIYACGYGNEDGYVYLPACRMVSSSSVPSKSPIENNSEYIISTNLGYVLDCYGGYSENETPVTLYSEHSGPNQVFIISESPYPEFFYIRASYCDKYFNVNFNPYSNQYKKLQLYDLTSDSANMLFKMIPSNNGYKLQTHYGDLLAYDKSGSVYATSDYVDEYYSTFYLEKISSSGSAQSLCSLEKAINYCDTYWNNYNTAYPKYKNNDCANYVSQIIHESGLQDDNEWTPESYAWVNVYGLKSYFCNKNGYNLKYISKPSASQIAAGDIVYTSSGHVMFVREVSNGRVYASGHTNNRQKMAITSFYGVIKTSELFN